MKIGCIHYILDLTGSTKMVTHFIKSFLNFENYTENETEIQSKKSTQKNEIIILTKQYDPLNCFDDFKTPKIKIWRHDRILPKSFFGKFTLVLQLIENLFLSTKFFSHLDFDFIVCDDIPIPFIFLKPIFRIFGSKTKFVFYCHFPNVLFINRCFFSFRMYRSFFDYLEKLAISFADVVFVNSYFTQKAFKMAFPGFQKETIVLYPPAVISVKKNYFNNHFRKLLKEIKNSKTKILLTINRFVPHKNIELAIETLSVLKKTTQFDLKLIIGGAFSIKNPDHIKYMKKIKFLIKNLNLKFSSFPDFSSDIIFLLNFNENGKNFAYEISDLMLYTPLNEHFGIVPIEAMGHFLPVISTNSGGPLETIIDGKTGFLCKPNSTDFAKKASDLLSKNNLIEKMALEGREHVLKKFSEEKFEKSFKKCIFQAEKQNIGFKWIYLLLFIVVFL